MQGRLNDLRQRAQARLTEAKALAAFTRDIAAVSRLRIALAKQKHLIGAEPQPEPLDLSDVAVICEAASALRRVRDHPMTDRGTASIADLAIAAVLRTVEGITAEMAKDEGRVR